LNPLSLRHARIPERYWEAQLPDIPAVHGYVRKISCNLQQGIGLILMGANGVGKTHTAVAIAKHVLLRTPRVLYLTGPDLIEALIHDQPYTEDMTIRVAVKTREFLVIDDLGSEYRGSGSGYSELNYLNLLRTRMQQLGKATLFTTNLDREGLEQAYGPGMISLLAECCLPLTLSGQDIRKFNQKDLAERSGIQ